MKIQWFVGDVMVAEVELEDGAVLVMKIGEKKEDVAEPVEEEVVVPAGAPEVEETPAEPVAEPAAEPEAAPAPAGEGEVKE